MMKSARFEKIKELCQRFDSLPDGAFLAVLAELGVDTDDLADYADECERRKPKRKKRR